MPPEPDPSNPRVLPRGSSSQEKAFQDEREATALSAVYMTSSQIPESPAEPASVTPDEDDMKDATEMVLGEEFTSLFFPNGEAEVGIGMSVDSTTDVSSLIGQLHNNVSMETSPVSNPVSANLPALTGFQPEQVQQLLAQLSSSIGGSQSLNSFGDVANTNDPAAWGAQAFSDFAQGYDDTDKQLSGRWEDRSGRGGRGRGAERGSRGRDNYGGKPYARKSRQCLFFQQQRRALNQTLIRPGH